MIAGIMELSSFYEQAETNTKSFYLLTILKGLIPDQATPWREAFGERTLHFR